MYPFRIGFGYDVHQLVEGRPLIIGGVKIDHVKGALGHSDADVLLHAICDALLGAAGLRDIGFHFPDSSAEYKNIDSRLLLKQTIALITEQGWKTGNIDCTIALQSPKIAPYITGMQLNIQEIVGSEPGTISVKATTTE
ncbi:MAG: 2-C-methyl-D-erythritol 2,4-cyclodiphosphate synthase, partial [Lentimicrobium sp.]|nr:2-C-methyl-D-erythritol 2,4-cyclodiphosphate synthase [Lentimicrobium sp.]